MSAPEQGRLGAPARCRWITASEAADQGIRLRGKRLVLENDEGHSDDFRAACEPYRNNPADQARWIIVVPEGDWYLWARKDITPNQGQWPADYAWVEVPE